MTEKKFLEFVSIMRRLRKECPWDREQTHDSIKAATLEEAYEVVHAIDEKDFSELKKELGDLLLHIAFHSVLAEESGAFTIDDVIDSISAKLIRRHPHVFGNVEVENNDDIMRNWESIKLQEGRKSVLEGIPSAMPALLRAFRVQEKASKVGFDWQNKKDVWDKVTEELEELSEAESSKNQTEVEEEFGDLLFSLVNYSRFITVNPENALRNSTKKFEERFKYIEEQLSLQGKSVIEATFEEMDELWNQSKKEL